MPLNKETKPDRFQHEYIDIKTAGFYILGFSA